MHVELPTDTVRQVLDATVDIGGTDPRAALWLVVDAIDHANRADAVEFERYGSVDLATARDAGRARSRLGHPSNAHFHCTACTSGIDDGRAGISHTCGV